jgi:hypothetical protein
LQDGLPPKQGDKTTFLLAELTQGLVREPAQGRHDGRKGTHAEQEKLENRPFGAKLPHTGSGRAQRGGYWDWRLNLGGMHRRAGRFCFTLWQLRQFTLFGIV